MKQIVTVDYEYQIVSANWTCPICDSNNNMVNECDVCGFNVCDTLNEMTAESFDYEFSASDIARERDIYLGLEDANEDE